MKIQHVLWCNWSGFVIFINVTSGIKNSCNQKVVYYIVSTIDFVVSYFMVSAMVLINIDRLLAVLLSIKYPLYVTSRRIVYAIIAIWSVSIVVCAGILFTYGVNHPITSSKKLKVVFVKIVGPIVDAVYLISTVVIYIIIFRYFVKSRKLPHMKGSVTGIDQMRQWYKVFRRSRFMVAFLLVLFYTLLVTIPDIVVAYIFNSKLHIIFLIAKRCSWICDAIVFVSMDTDMRRQLRRMRSNLGEADVCSN